MVDTRDMTNVIIITGEGGSGKSSFIKGCKQYGYISKKARIRELSVVDYPKRVATFCGWSGGKSEKDRKFLSDIKLALMAWDHSPLDFLFKEILDYEEKEREYENLILFVNSRESYDVEEINKFCSDCEIPCFAIRVDRTDYLSNEVPFLKDEVKKIDIKTNIINNSTLVSLSNLCGNFVDDVLANSVKEKYKANDYVFAEENVGNVVTLDELFEKTKELKLDNIDNFSYNQCEHCSNNPKNGGSGICNCTIPYLNNPTYYTDSYF